MGPFGPIFHRLVGRWQRTEPANVLRQSPKSMGLRLVPFVDMDRGYQLAINGSAHGDLAAQQYLSKPLDHIMDQTQRLESTQVDQSDEELGTEDSFNEFCHHHHHFHTVHNHNTPHAGNCHTHANSHLHYHHPTQQSHQDMKKRKRSPMDDSSSGSNPAQIEAPIPTVPDMLSSFAGSSKAVMSNPNEQRPMDSRHDVLTDDDILDHLINECNVICDWGDHLEGLCRHVETSNEHHEPCNHIHEASTKGKEQKCHVVCDRVDNSGVSCHHITTTEEEHVHCHHIQKENEEALIHEHACKVACDAEADCDEVCHHIDSSQKQHGNCRLEDEDQQGDDASVDENKAILYDEEDFEKFEDLIRQCAVECGLSIGQQDPCMHSDSFLEYQHNKKARWNSGELKNDADIDLDMAASLAPQASPSTALAESNQRDETTNAWLSSSGKLEAVPVTTNSTSCSTTTNQPGASPHTCCKLDRKERNRLSAKLSRERRRLTLKAALNRAEELNMALFHSASRGQALRERAKQLEHAMDQIVSHLGQPRRELEMLLSSKSSEQKFL